MTKQEKLRAIYTPEHCLNSMAATQEAIISALTSEGLIDQGLTKAMEPMVRAQEAHIHEYVEILVEAMSEEEVDLLYDLYQNPLGPTVVLKLSQVPQTASGKLAAWSSKVLGAATGLDFFGEKEET